MTHEIIIILSVLALVFNAGYFNGIMDYIKKYRLDYQSWKNKWKLDSLGNPYPVVNAWYYFKLYTPEHEERHPYSSTLLVFLTDEWHMKKWQMFFCYELALSCIIVSYENLPFWYAFIGIILLKTIRGLGFSLKYDKKIR